MRGKKSWKVLKQLLWHRKSKKLVCFFIRLNSNAVPEALPVCRNKQKTNYNVCPSGPTQ